MKGKQVTVIAIAGASHRDLYVHGQRLVQGPRLFERDGAIVLGKERHIALDAGRQDRRALIIRRLVQQLPEALARLLILPAGV